MLRLSLWRIVSLKKLSILSNEHTELINKNDEAYETIKNLQDSCMKVEPASSDHTMVKELKEALKDRDNDILELKVALKAAKEASYKLNGVLGQNRVQYEKEKSLIFKEHRAEVKSLKKELGNEVKEKIRLEKELEEILIANENKVNKRSKKKKKKVLRSLLRQNSPLQIQKSFAVFVLNQFLIFNPSIFVVKDTTQFVKLAKHRIVHGLKTIPFQASHQSISLLLWFLIGYLLNQHYLRAQA